jgi:hypothetical protein
MSDQGGDEVPQAAGGGGHLDWKGVYEKRLVKVFETLNLLPPALAPLAKEFGEALAEWAAVPLLLRRLRRGMDKMASLSPSTPAPSAPDSEHVWSLSLSSLWLPAIKRRNMGGGKSEGGTSLPKSEELSELAVARNWRHLKCVATTHELMSMAAVREHRRRSRDARCCWRRKR